MAYSQIIFFLILGQFKVLSEQNLFSIDFENFGKFLSSHGVTCFVESIFDVLGWNLVNKDEEEELIETNRAILVNIRDVEHMVYFFLVFLVEFSFAVWPLELERSHSVEEHGVAHSLLTVNDILSEVLVNLLRVAEESYLVVIKTILLLLLASWGSLSDVLILKIHVRCEGHGWEDEMSKVETVSIFILLLLAIVELLPGGTVVGSSGWSSHVCLLEELLVALFESCLSETLAEHGVRFFELENFKFD